MKTLDEVDAQLDALAARGEAALEGGAVELAEHAFTQILEVDPTHARALGDLGVLRYQQGAVDEARRLLNQAAVFAADPADALINLGAIAEAEGDLALAASYFAHPALGGRRDAQTLTAAAGHLEANGSPVVAARIRRAVQMAHPRRVDPRIYDEVGILRLEAHQIYPPGEELNPDFFLGERHRLIDKSTPIASIGSCFAREVKDHLVRSGFNYLQTADGPHARHGSAAWDRVYNTFCLRQEFERALGDFDPRTAAWVLPDGRRLDPYRKGVTWASPAAQAAELEAHRRTARKAFVECEALVVTVGLNEIWYDRQSGDVFFQVPPRALFDEAQHGFRTATVDENLANLERMHDLLQATNPGCRMLVTVSPVPLRATFRKTHNVVVSNVESKSTLLVATKAFVARHPETVFYFPSYEIVQTAVTEPFELDNRHVKRSTVAQIMRVFEHAFLSDPA